MASSEMVILDVGHGNCAIIQHGEDAIIVDAPSKPIVARALDDFGIKFIHSLIISHADSDHLSGAIPLLMDEQRPVGHVYVNPDNRQAEAWRRFRVAAGSAMHRGTRIHAELNQSNPDEVVLAETRITILHPTPDLCLATVNGLDAQGIQLNPNSMSAVVLVEHEGRRVCLLAADSDRYSLDAMLANQTNIRAPILVFPHHGGRAGTHDNQAFARDMTHAVQPEVVLFSLGRGAHGTPRPEIIRGVNEAMGQTRRSPYVACTQLSTRCSAVIPAPSDRMVDKLSDGYKRNYCCAGTVTVPLHTNSVSSLIQQLAANHGSFLANSVPNAMCLKRH